MENEKINIGKELKIKASKQCWRKVYDYIKKSLQLIKKEKNIKTNSSVMKELLIACEEIYINIASYAYPDDKNGDVYIQCGCLPGEKIFVEFTDSGVKFNPTKEKTHKAKKGLHECKIGGLGLVMVKKLSDGMEYKREGNKNVLTIIKET